jgi:microcystin-dependent protein
MDVFIGMIMPVGFNYVPEGWLPCEGQVLSIDQYTTLYTLLGTTYGGDGVTTFGLPDLRGRAPLGTTLATTPTNVALVLRPGQITGNLSVQGTVTGTTSVTVGTANLPAHTHPVLIPGGALKASSTLHVSASAGQATPVGGSLLGTGGSGQTQAAIYASNVTPDVTLAPASVSTILADVSVASASTGAATPAASAATVGGSAQIGVMQPSIGISYLIAVTGIFPPHP